MKKIFISYSHKDEDYKKQFEAHLSGLRRQNIIDVWDDRQSIIGDKWDEKIQHKLSNSDIVIFLISSDFLSSEYINEIEIKRTILRHKKNEVLLFPIFLRPCDFESSILSEFQGAPRDLKFITTWGCLDSAFLDVINELKRAIKEFLPNEKSNTKSDEFVDKHLDLCDTPPDIPKWVGREDELEILSSKHFKVIFITGFGGQGKSSLATKYIYKQREENIYDGWDWRNFKEEGSRLKTTLIEIIKRYGSNDASVLDLKDSTYDVLIDIVFDTIGHRKILFVFDNIDSYIDYEKFEPLEGFQQLIKESLTRKHNCKFIFTCRPFIKKADVGFYQIELKGLKYEDTVRLLDKYSISIVKNKKEGLYEELHKITNGHPFWLNLLGAQAVSGVGKLEKFIKNIRAHTNFDEADVSQLLSDRIIGAMWDSLNAKQQKLLRCLSEIIKAEEFKDLAKMVENELSYNQFNKALNRLKLLNLVVTKSIGQDKKEYELHPLVKNFVKGKYPPSERSKYISIIIDYYNRITYVLKERISGNESLRFYENWTNKVELAINKRDFPLALSTLQEISDSILTAGYFEEYFRISKLLLEQIDIGKHYRDETPYLISQISCFVHLSSEIAQFDAARRILDQFRDIINNKGKDYVIYCKLEMGYYWSKLDNMEAINWGNKALTLAKNGKIDVGIDLEHSLNLAKRDSRKNKYVNEALLFFLRGNDIKSILNSPIDENLSAQYYGNIGRCYYFLGEYSFARSMYFISFDLCYKEENSSRFINRGYASYWLGQVLQKEGKLKIAFLFYLNCLSYWKKHAPHRAKEVEEEMKMLQKEIPDIQEILKVDNETIENQCIVYSEAQLKAIWRAAS